MDKDILDGAKENAIGPPATAEYKGTRCLLVVWQSCSTETEAGSQPPGYLDDIVALVMLH